MSTLFSYYDIIYFDTFNGCKWSVLSKIKKEWNRILMIELLLIRL